LEEQAAFYEEERLKREEALRFAAVQDRMQAKLAAKEVKQVSTVSDSLTALKERLEKFSVNGGVSSSSGGGGGGSISMHVPKLDFKPLSGGIQSYSSKIQSSPSLLSKLNPSLNHDLGASSGDKDKSLFEMINTNGVCVMPMLSFEVAVFALTIFLSELDFELVDFLKITEKFFGIYIALIGAVSVATPGGELVMLCCVHEVNDLVLRTWLGMMLFSYTKYLSCVYILCVYI
jgi:hypothetical protein